MKKLIILCLLLPLMAQSNNDYLNKNFPTIQGISLSNNEVIFPDVLDGRPAVLAMHLDNEHKNVLIPGQVIY